MLNSLRLLSPGPLNSLVLPCKISLGGPGYNILFSVCLSWPSATRTLWQFEVHLPIHLVSFFQTSIYFEILSTQIVYIGIITIWTVFQIYRWSVVTFLLLLRRFNPAEPVVEKSVILQRIKISRAFPRFSRVCPSNRIVQRSTKGL